jgi:hypothetical protein
VTLTPCKPEIRLNDIKEPASASVTKINMLIVITVMATAFSRTNAGHMKSSREEICSGYFQL